MTLRRLLSSTLLLAGGVGLLAMALPSYRHGEPSVAGRRAPNFSFTLDERPTDLAALQGRFVVVHFWASWCPPCVEEAPALETLAETVRPWGIIVLGVSADQDADAYQRFLQQFHFRFPNLRDPTGTIAARYGTHLYPETYLVGPDGRLVRKWVGPQNWHSPAMVAYFRALVGRQSSGHPESSTVNTNGQSDP